MTPHRIDSGQVLAALGAFFGFVVAHADKISATVCALTGLAYTIWKWRREARRFAESSRSPFDEP